jgi:16S rRNA (cytidine1402-2'-O)-methyltransferase
LTDYSLFIVPTPIGNRQDITLRALETLRQVEWVAAEDTRNTGLLLQAYDIKAKFISLHEHNEVGKAELICKLLAKGESVALVSDAGTPLISDPGAKLISIIIANGFRVVPLPGACAAICALSAAGLDTTSFLFLGFLSAKTAARQKQLLAIAMMQHTLIFYEAARRLEDCVTDIVACLGGEREIVLARELTKIHEEIIRCAAKDLLIKLANKEIILKGECVLLVAGNVADQDKETIEAARVLKTVMPHTSLKSAVAITVQLTGARKSVVYDLALQL